ncbi:hypothetical protein N431DRAFT_465293 [Stipitochalara longipes BDJ]|nr:hypothetical protein N431DRAFT_465293 [Stipitochalara longipes BDJ]
MTMFLKRLTSLTCAPFSKDVTLLASLLQLHYGCARAGKTTCIVGIMHLMLAQAKKVLVCSLTNPATNNVYNRFADTDTEKKYRKIRLHPDQFESAELLRFGPIKHPKSGWSSPKKMKRAAKFSGNILLRATSSRDILRKPIIDRDEDDQHLLKSCLKTCAENLLTKADIVFSTCITAISKWLRKFRDLINKVFLDKVGYMTSTNAMIILKGDLPCVMAGDLAQLSAPCMSANMRYPAGPRVNPMVD